MLQFKTTHSDKYSTAEQVHMAIEGGCKWIELSIDNLKGDRYEAMRLAAEEVIPECRAVDAFLILNNEPDLALELECHGLHIDGKGTLTPAEAREKLGAGAIIGVTVSSAEEALALRRLDIDYFTVDNPSIETVKEIVEALRGANVKIPLVATGNIDAETAPAYIAAGASGVEVGAAIVNADDPVLYTAKLIAEITR